MNPSIQACIIGQIGPHAAGIAIALNDVFVQCDRTVPGADDSTETTRDAVDLNKASLNCCDTAAGKTQEITNRALHLGATRDDGKSLALDSPMLTKLALSVRAPEMSAGIPPAIVMSIPFAAKDAPMILTAPAATRHHTPQLVPPQPIRLMLSALKPMMLQP